MVLFLDKLIHKCIFSWFWNVLGESQQSRAAWGRRMRRVTRLFGRLSGLPPLRCLFPKASSSQLEASHLLDVFRITISLDFDLRSGFSNVLHIFCRELKRFRTDVLIEA